jgi:pimeloyl-ACP methyl ester carboxylesterase
MALGLMTKRKVPDEITDDWLRPLLSQRRICEDLRRYLRATHKRDMLDAAEGLSAFDRPALVVWADDDRVMPIVTGKRLAASLPQGEFVTISDSRTLIPEDQPSSFLDSYVTSSLGIPYEPEDRASSSCPRDLGGVLIPPVAFTVSA